jgi:hypothetical protein
MRNSKYSEVCRRGQSSIKNKEAQLNWASQQTQAKFLKRNLKTTDLEN